MTDHCKWQIWLATAPVAPRNKVDELAFLNQYRTSPWASYAGLDVHFIDVRLVIGYLQKCGYYWMAKRMKWNIMETDIACIVNWYFRLMNPQP